MDLKGSLVSQLSRNGELLIQWKSLFQGNKAGSVSDWAGGGACHQTCRPDCSLLVPYKGRRICSPPTSCPLTSTVALAPPQTHTLNKQINVMITNSKVLTHTTHTHTKTKQTPCHWCFLRLSGVTHPSFCFLLSHQADEWQFLPLLGPNVCSGW